MHHIVKLSPNVFINVNKQFKTSTQEIKTSTQEIFARLLSFMICRVTTKLKGSTIDTKQFSTTHYAMCCHNNDNLLIKRR